MGYELTLTGTLILLASGVAAGFINTLAGGGSLLTLPALMLLGLPADIANATNRVSVLLSSVEGVRSFRRHGKFDQPALLPLLVPAISGSLTGALLASYLPTAVLEPVLLITLVMVAITIAVRPGTVMPPEGTEPLGPLSSPATFGSLFFAGLFGGFIQAGVGFVLIAALCGVLRYDLVRANALKLAATGIFSVVALTVFVLRGQVIWIPGLLLAVGTILGVKLSVRFSLSVDHGVLRYILLVAVILVCLAAWLK